MRSRKLLLSSWVAAGALALATAASAAFVKSEGSPLLLPAGSAPQSVAAGDFNNDGNPDIAVTAYGLDRVSLFLGNGAGGFAAVRHFPAGNNPTGLAVGDFDEDDDLDLAVTNNVTPGRVTLLFGNDDGEFPTNASEIVGSNPLGVVAGDLNGDGNADLAVANSADGSVSILHGDGDGDFTEAAGSPVPTGGALPQFLARGDLNDDGRADLVVVNTGDNSVSVLLALAGGGFGLADGSPFFAGPAPMGVAVGDLDRDGRPDLVVSNAVNAGELTLFFGDGDGGFPQWDVLEVGANPTFVAVAAIDGDNLLDIMTANQGSNDISFLAGRGNGTFLPAVQTPAGNGPLTLALDDFDRDELTDIAVTNNLGDAVTVLLQGDPVPEDTTPPVTTATLAPAPNAAGWHRDDVRVTLRATDTGGSGVDFITYSATGAQAFGPRVVNDDEVSFFIDEEGVTVIRFFATDNAGNVEVAKTVTVRIDRTEPDVTASASPDRLFPPNGKLVTVTVTGQVEDDLSGVAASSGRFVVDDEYGDVEPSGSFVIGKDGSYRFTVKLPARRKGNDRSGRLFTIRVTALDVAGNLGEATTQVLVPHDRRAKRGNRR